MNGSRTLLASVLVSALALGAFPGTVRVAFADDTKPAPAMTGAAATSSVPAAPKVMTKAPTAPTTSAAAGTAVAAGPKPGDIKGLTAAGEKKFKAGDYAGALEDFKQVEEIKTSPEVSRLMGLSFDNLNRYQDAVLAYQRFLADVPTKMTKEGNEIRMRVEAIKVIPAHVKVSALPADATITVDGDAEHKKTAPAEFELAPGHHKIDAAAANFDPGSKEIDVDFADKQDVNIELKETPPPPPPPAPAVVEPPPAPPPPPPPPPAEKSHLPAYITGGIAIVAAGVGTGFGIAALSTQSDFNKNPTTSTADSGENQALIADMCFGIAITFGVTSAVLFLSDNGAQSASNDVKKHEAKKTETKKSSVSIIPTPIITAHGGGAGALVRF